MSVYFEFTEALCDQTVAANNLCKQIHMALFHVRSGNVRFFYVHLSFPAAVIYRDAFVRGILCSNSKAKTLALKVKATGQGHMVEKIH